MSKNLITPIAGRLLTEPDRRPTPFLKASLVGEDPEAPTVVSFEALSPDAGAEAQPEELIVWGSASIPMLQPDHVVLEKPRAEQDAILAGPVWRQFAEFAVQAYGVDVSQVQQGEKAASWNLDGQQVQLAFEGEEYAFPAARVVAAALRLAQAHYQHGDPHAGVGGFRYLP